MSGDQPQKSIERTVTEKLRDGQVVKIRPISKDDVEMERDFIEKLSPESRHFRFLGGITKPSEKMLRQFTDIDHDKQEAFIAIVESDSKESEIGVSRYAVDPDGNACEFAVVVRDDWQKRGVGTLLINRLIETARSRGIKRLYSIESSENFKVRNVAKAMGFQRQTDPNDKTQVIYTLDL